MGCLFCKIANGELPATIIYEDNDVLAFHDIDQQAPTHLLIIPRKHISTINDTETNDQQLLGHLLLTAKRLAHENQLSNEGYRLVFNVNPAGGQTVYHIHLHLLGGRQMTWPPG
ncbi:MAG: histidine triad nucleotide-binding protein [Legionella sp.]